MKKIFNILKNIIIEIKTSWYFYILVFAGIFFVILGALS
jgi:hypothetical protein